MAITDIAAYTHLSDTDIETFGRELDAIRRDVEESRGTSDAAYIRRTIRFQRLLDVAARLLIWGSRSRASWAMGTAALAYAKVVENMEIGHNVSHGQWDWMNDPEIHSTTWEWDMVALVVAVEVLAQLSPPRVQQRDRHGRRSRLRRHAGDPRPALEAAVSAAATSERGAGHDLRMGHRSARCQCREPVGWAPPKGRRQDGELMRKVARQAVKDYVLFPALSVRRWRQHPGAPTRSPTSCATCGRTW